MDGGNGHIAMMGDAGMGLEPVRTKPTQHAVRAFGLDPEGIKRRVTEHEQRTTELRARFEADYDRYLLTEPEPEDGYQIYTANGPQTFADKVMSWLTGASLLIRYPVERKGRGQRAQEDAKEQFIIGALRQADEYLADLGLPPLRDQLAFYITVRGWYCGRVLLTKEGGRTLVEVMPWDPLHAFWGPGSRNGPMWACYRMKRRERRSRRSSALPPPTSRHPRRTMMYMTTTTSPTTRSASPRTG